ncbi:APC family permease, partial [Francisellaceae bacterium]|nr:APC family permease [Francisellaceae bacterium]
LAPVIVFGFIAATSGETVALPFILGFVAMLFTANSYAFMVKRYPVAGSLYVYISKCITPYVGFIAGWVLLLDYLFLPTITGMSVVPYFRQFFPDVPAWLVLVVCILSTGTINLLGVKFLMRMGLFLLIIGELILVASFIIWGKYIVDQNHSVMSLLSFEPFKFDSISALLTATSIAVFSFLGFGAITTLAEEAKNPVRDIPRAIFISIIIGTITMTLIGYLGVLASPDIKNSIHDLVWRNTALFFVSERSGGEIFAIIFTSAFILSQFVCNIVATTACSRLLYGMGRDGVFPKKIFGKVNKRFQTPHYNILLIMALEIVIGLCVSIQTVSEMINFGALLSFILLNISVMVYTFKRWKLQRNGLGIMFKQLLFPLLGIVVLLAILILMHTISLVVGCCWLTIGLIYSAVLWRYRKSEVSLNPKKS